MPVIPFLFLPAAAVLMRLPKFIGYAMIVLAGTISLSMAMARNQYGVHTNIIHVFVEGLQLPWLNTLGKMSAQYAPWLDGRPSALPAYLLAGVILYGIWGVRKPWRSPAYDA